MKKTKLIATATLFSSLSMAFGVTLQFDIGGGALFDGTDNATNAPAGIADASYNGLSNSSPISSTLVFGDGTAATGVTAQLADGPDDPATNFFTTGLSGGVSSNTSGTGVGGTDLTNDWVFTRNNDNLGFRVSGLAVGEYDVYALVREPNQLGRTYDVGIGIGNTSNIADLTTQSIAPITDNTLIQLLFLGILRQGLEHLEVFRLLLCLSLLVHFYLA